LPVTEAVIDAVTEPVAGLDDSADEVDLTVEPIEDVTPWAVELMDEAFEIVVEEALEVEAFEVEVMVEEALDVELAAFEVEEALVVVDCETGFEVVDVALPVYVAIVAGGAAFNWYTLIL